MNQHDNAKDMTQLKALARLSAPVVLCEPLPPRHSKVWAQTRA